jgi:hypothetical protein
MEAEFRSVCTLKQAVGRAGVEAGQKMCHYSARLQNDRHSNAALAASLRMTIRERKLTHFRNLPATKRQFVLRRNMR